MNIICILTARLASERLPGKAMVEYGTPPRPNLAWMVDRYTATGSISKVVIATTKEREDDVIVEWCKRENVPYFRGSTYDVTERIYNAAKDYQPDYILRGTHDCPFVEIGTLDMAIDVVAYHGADAGRLFGPPGQVAIYGAAEYPYSWRAVELLHEFSRDDEREHFGWLLERHRDMFTMVYPKPPPEFYSTYFRPYRLELDTYKDLKLVHAIYDELQDGTEPIPMWKVIHLLDNRPDLVSINQTIMEKTGPGTSFDVETWREWGADMEDKMVPWDGEWAWMQGKPSEARALWCRKKTCYLGWLERKKNRGNWQTRLHRPDGTVVVGDADIPCACGAGLKWRIA